MATVTHAAETHTCHRCGGFGYLKQFSHVQGGVCFGCMGSGAVDRPAPYSDPETAEATERAVYFRNATGHRAYRLSYRQDGDAHTVQLTPYGAAPGTPIGFLDVTAARAYWKRMADRLAIKGFTKENKVFAVADGEEFEVS